MKIRITRVVPEWLRMKGMEPYVDSKVVSAFPSDIDKLVDNCHYIVVEHMPEEVPLTENV